MRASLLAALRRFGFTTWRTARSLGVEPRDARILVAEGWLEVRANAARIREYRQTHRGFIFASANVEDPVTAPGRTK